LFHLFSKSQLRKDFKKQQQSKQGTVSEDVDDFQFEEGLPAIEETLELISDLPESNEVPLPVDNEKEEDSREEVPVIDLRDQDPTSNLLDSLFNTSSPDASVPKEERKSPAKRKNKKSSRAPIPEANDLFPNEQMMNYDEQPPLITSSLVEEFSAHHHVIHDLSDHSATKLFSHPSHRKSQYNPGNIDLPFSPHPAHSGFLHTSSDEEGEEEQSSDRVDPPPPEMDKVDGLSDYGSDNDQNLLEELEEKDHNTDNQNEEFDMYDDTSEIMAATYASEEDHYEDHFLTKEPEIVDLSDVSEGIITELDHEILAGNDIQSNLTDDEYPYSHFQSQQRISAPDTNVLDNNSVSDISDIFHPKQKASVSLPSQRKKTSPKKIPQLSVVKPKPKELKIKVEEHDDEVEAANKTLNAELNDVLYELHENINELHPFSPVSPPSTFPLEKSITNEEIRYRF
jgi:hypothetical protein